MLQEMNLKNALAAYAAGQKVMVLFTGSDGDLKVSDLDELFSGGRLLVDKKESVKKNPPSKQPARKRVKVDIGKLQALHKAGWSISKIADELGVSWSTVDRHLKDNIKRKEGGGENVTEITT